MSTAELKLNGTTIISESGGVATIQNTALDAGVTIPSNLDIEAASKTAFNATGDAPVYACRAWVNFNGTGTVAIRASGNISSITDDGTGLYTINFTTAMPDANYAVAGIGRDGTNAVVNISLRYNVVPATSSLAINTTGGGIFKDLDYVNIIVIR